MLPLLLLACDAKDANTGPLVPIASACPGERVDDPVAGDANGDGRVDISDGVYFHRWQLSGGDAPFCDGAMDVLNDDIVELSDGFAIWHALFSGSNTLPERVRDDCTERSGVEDGACGQMGLAVVSEPRVEGPAGGTATFTATVQARSLSLPLQAWSYGVAADGCTATASTAGTVSANAGLDTEGLRDHGFDRTEPVDGGVVSAVVLSWRQETVVPASETAVTIAKLSVQAPVPSSGCATCTLTPTGDLEGPGEPVRVVFASGGHAYEPLATAARVEVCAGG